MHGQSAKSTADSTADLPRSRNDDLFSAVAAKDVAGVRALLQLRPGAWIDKTQGWVSNRILEKMHKCSGGLQIGETALHMAAGLGHFEIVVMLLNGGASYGATDKVSVLSIIENDRAIH